MEKASHNSGIFPLLYAVRGGYVPMQHSRTAQALRHRHFQRLRHSGFRSRRSQAPFRPPYKTGVTGSHIFAPDLSPRAQSGALPPCHSLLFPRQTAFSHNPASQTEADKNLPHRIRPQASRDGSSPPPASAEVPRYTPHALQEYCGQNQFFWHCHDSPQ